MTQPTRVVVFDTTLRDGEQAPGFSMDVATKLTLARALDLLGVDIIEAGFPISSEGDFEAVRTIAGAVRRPIIAGLARIGTLFRLLAAIHWATVGLDGANNTKQLAQLQLYDRWLRVWIDTAERRR